MDPKGQLQRHGNYLKRYFYFKAFQNTNVSTPAKYVRPTGLRGCCTRGAAPALLTQ